MFIVHLVLYMVRFVVDMVYYDMIYYLPWYTKVCYGILWYTRAQYTEDDLPLYA